MARNSAERLAFRKRIASASCPIVIFAVIVAAFMACATAPRVESAAVIDKKDIVDGNIAAVKRDIEGGADVNARDPDGATPLMAAAATDREEILLLLIRAGADVNAQANKGLTALLIASSSGYEDIVEALLRSGADIRAKFSTQDSLHLASVAGFLPIVRMLLAAGADINGRNGRGETPLMVAADGGHAPVVQLLIDSGADTNAGRDDGATALMIASWQGYTSVARILAQGKATIDLSNSRGQTALMYGSENGKTDIVRYLLEEGASVNMTANDGTQPLMFASLNGHVEIVSMLIDHGAGINHPNSHGQTPLMAVKGPACARILLDAGADPDARDVEGNTALMYAVDRDETEVARLLLAAGADVNAVPKNGYTPLMRAITGKHDDLVEMLKQRMIELATEREESSYLPFVITRDEVKEILRIQAAAGVLAKPLSRFSSESLAVPSGITYAALEPSKNEAIANEFVARLGESSSGAASLQGDSRIIFGPHLAGLLKQADLLRDFSYKKILTYVPNRMPFVLFTCAIATQSAPLAISLVRNLLFSGDTLIARKLNERELRWYWSIISWDIEEPIFVFDNGRHALLVDLSKDGKLFYVDLLDGLQS
jgi:ankyrin repeat protein